MPTLLVTKMLHVKYKTNVDLRTAISTVKPVSKIANRKYENKLKTQGKKKHNALYP